MPNSTNDNRLFAVVGGIAAILIMDSAVAHECRPSPPREMMPRPEGKAPGSMIPDVPGPQSLGADSFYLLENSIEVQKNLGLAKDQLARLNPASRNFRTRLQDLSDPKPTVTQEWTRTEIESHMQDARGMIARELTPIRLARIQQIILQLEGPCLAVIDQPVGQRPSLTDQQNQAITRACHVRTVQMREAFQPQSAVSNFCATMQVSAITSSRFGVAPTTKLLALLEPSQKGNVSSHDWKEAATHAPDAARMQMTRNMLGQPSDHRRLHPSCELSFPRGS